MHIWCSPAAGISDLLFLKFPRLLRRIPPAWQLRLSIHFARMFLTTWGVFLLHQFHQTAHRSEMPNSVFFKGFRRVFQGFRPRFRPILPTLSPVLGLCTPRRSSEFIGSVTRESTRPSHSVSGLALTRQYAHFLPVVFLCLRWFLLEMCLLPLLRN